MKKPKRTVHIQFRKLGREHALGQILEDDKSTLIEIDPRLDADPAVELYTVIHEAIHFTYKFLDEAAVVQGAHDIAEIMFQYGYRKEKK